MRLPAAAVALVLFLLCHSSLGKNIFCKHCQLKVRSYADQVKSTSTLSPMHKASPQYFFILLNERRVFVKSFAPCSEPTLAKHKPVWIFSNKRRLLMKRVKGCVKLLNYVPLPLSEVWPLMRPAPTAKQSCRNSQMK